MVERWVRRTTGDDDETEMLSVKLHLRYKQTNGQMDGQMPGIEIGAF